jgi:hypothetical protein
MNCSEIDIQQADYLKFKALQKIEIGPKFSKENESIKSLLVTSQKYGFMIAATERGSSIDLISMLTFFFSDCSKLLQNIFFFCYFISI